MEFYTKRLKAQRIPQPVPMILLCLKYSGGELYVERALQTEELPHQQTPAGHCENYNSATQNRHGSCPGMLSLVAILLVGLLACRIFASCMSLSGQDWG